MPVEMTMNLENYFGKLDHVGKAVFPLAASEALNDVSFGTIRLLKKEIPKYNNVLKRLLKISDK